MGALYDICDLPRGAVFPVLDARISRHVLSLLWLFVTILTQSLVLLFPLSLSSLVFCVSKKLSDSVSPVFLVAETELN